MLHRRKIFEIDRENPGFLREKNEPPFKILATPLYYDALSIALHRLDSTLPNTGNQQTIVMIHARQKNAI
jgi:hypothetical protein